MATRPDGNFEITVSMQDPKPGQFCDFGECLRLAKGTLGYSTSSGFQARVASICETHIPWGVKFVDSSATFRECKRLKNVKRRMREPRAEK